MTHSSAYVASVKRTLRVRDGVLGHGALPQAANSLKALNDARDCAGLTEGNAGELNAGKGEKQGGEKRLDSRLLYGLD
jgi:hypothetical protein